MSEKKNPLGPIGENVRANIQRLRAHRGMSYRELSDRLATVGRPIPALGLSRLESGNRRVDVDDLMAFAEVFGTTPAYLMGKPQHPHDRNNHCPACVEAIDHRHYLQP